MNTEANAALAGKWFVVNVGDELFRYIEGGGIHRFKVLGIRQYEDSIQYEVEDQNCTHGWKCRILIAHNDYGKLHAVHMLNEDENNSQRHWHTNEGYHFYPSSNEAKAEAYNAALRRAYERVEKAQKALTDAKDRRDELNDLLAQLSKEPT